MLKPIGNVWPIIKALSDGCKVYDGRPGRFESKIATGQASGRFGGLALVIILGLARTEVLGWFLNVSCQAKSSSK